MNEENIHESDTKSILFTNSSKISPVKMSKTDDCKHMKNRIGFIDF